MVMVCNPMVARLCTVVDAAKTERTIVTRRWELQTEVHYGCHVPLCGPSCHGRKNGCHGGGCHAERCL